MDDTTNPPSDGAILGADRLADRAAIQDLATAYAHASDDGDWVRWESLFLPEALIDYTSAGGIAGNPAEVASWMPGALSIFTFCLHTTATHDISFTGPNRATGRVHVFNRNGVMWDGRPEIVDIGAVYHDAYERRGDHWKIATRIEHTTYIVGGTCADLIREAAQTTAIDGRPPPFG
jgi:hypothetical protein